MEVPREREGRTRERKIRFERIGGKRENRMELIEITVWKLKLVQNYEQTQKD